MTKMADGDVENTIENFLEMYDRLMEEENIKNNYLPFSRN